MKIKSLGYNIPKSPVSLEKVRTLEAFEGDLLIEMHDKKGVVYLKMWVDQDDEATRWLIFKISPTTLHKFLKREVTLRDVIYAVPDGNLLAVDASNLGKDTYSILRSTALPDAYMPTTESYHERVKIQVGKTT